MIKVATLSLHSEPEKNWDDYVCAQNGSIYHRIGWRHVIKEVFGHDSFYLYATNDDNQIIGVLPLVHMKSLLFGNYLVSMPYFNDGGCIANDEVIADALLKKSEELRVRLGCSHSEIRTSEKMHELKNELPCRTDKVAMILELPKASEELWKSIGAKRRAQVKRPIREGAEFVFGGSELIDDFYHVFSINMRDLGTPVYSKSFFKAIFKWFPEYAKIAVVRLNGEAVGAGFLLGDNDKMEIPWASTLRKVNKIGVNMYLYWNILQQTIAMEYLKFDFGRSSKDSGTLRFKKQWGSEEKPLYWYYQLEQGDKIPQMNPQNSKYKLMINVWKKMPLSLCNTLGPLIVKGLP